MPQRTENIASFAVCITLAGIEASLFSHVISEEDRTELLLRPDEVSSRITHPAILEIGNDAFGSSVQHCHVFVGSLA